MRHNWKNLFRSPGGGVVHPVPLVSIVLLVLNDHWWKWEFGTWWTGKLSDVVGLIFFPLLLQSFWELGRAALGKPFRPSRRVLIIAAVATAVVFGLIQVWTPAAEAYRHGLGVVSWPLWASIELISSGSIPPVQPVSLTMDPTDLLTIPAVGVAVAVGWRRCNGED